jgi:hypothetical protein
LLIATNSYVEFVIIFVLCKQMAEALREEARKQMSLISSIMDIMTSGLWNQPMSDDASYEFEGMQQNKTKLKHTLKATFTCR